MPSSAHCLRVRYKYSGVLKPLQPWLLLPMCIHLPLSPKLCPSASCPCSGHLPFPLPTLSTLGKAVLRGRGGHLLSLCSSLDGPSEASRKLCSCLMALRGETGSGHSLSHPTVVSSPLHAKIFWMATYRTQWAWKPQNSFHWGPTYSQQRR